MDKESELTSKDSAGPDAHGQAALLLVESLIHGLIARSALSVKDAIEIVQIAAEVKQDVGAAWGDSPDRLRKSIHLLSSISASLMHDVPSVENFASVDGGRHGDPPSPRRR